jgi:prepilin-type N-terminal cleavage/methylation domain-containing protein
MLITNNKKAFTLIEVILSIFIFSLLAFVANRFIFFSYRTHGYAEEQSRAINEARKGVDAMVKDIRTAKTAEDGSYPIERADDKQFVFYSDIDSDGKTEKVRYFLGTINSGNAVQECTISGGGGACSVTFSNFFTGTLKSAQVRVLMDGDLDASNEYITAFVDSDNIGNLCVNGCVHCAGTWQGTTVFDVTSDAGDNSLTFLADASSNVSKQCPPATQIFAAKARFELSWAEEVIGLGNELKKGVIEPVGNPATYPSDQEQVSLVTSYVRNDPPIFKYYDAAGNEIVQLPARLDDTKLMKVYMVINVDPNRPPVEFQLEEYVELRNLKTE